MYAKIATFLHHWNRLKLLFGLITVYPGSNTLATHQNIHTKHTENVNRQRKTDEKLALLRDYDWKSTHWGRKIVWGFQFFFLRFGRKSTCIWGGQIKEIAWIFSTVLFFLPLKNEFMILCFCHLCDESFLFPLFFFFACCFAFKTKILFHNSLYVCV